MVVYPNVKLNLGLSVLRKRQDGYHDIETLFIPYFGMSDVLEIVPSDKLRFVASDNVTWDDDLTVRAYQLLKADLEKRTGLKITRIEVGMLDFLKDSTLIRIFYDDPNDVGNSIARFGRMPKEM